MDSLYFYGLLALGGLCAHLYEYPPHEFHTLPHLGSDCETYSPLWNPLVMKAKFQSITRQIYPTWLQLGEPESEGKIVNYLDMSIWQQDGIWQSKLYDKRVGLQSKGLKLNKFPHLDTKITTRCKYGV